MLVCIWQWNSPIQIRMNAVALAVVRPPIPGTVIDFLLSDVAS